MKKKYYAIIYFTFSVTFCSAMNKNLIRSKTDSIYLISKITFTVNPSGFDIAYNDLKINNQYKIIIDSNGKVELTWPGKCPNKTLLTCSYFGKIPKDKFNEIKKYLIQINFIKLAEDYDEETDDSGSNTYEIIFNNDKRKYIRDPNYNIPILIELKKKIIKIKNETKWSENI
jgi:hypothetical protein